MKKAIFLLLACATLSPAAMARNHTRQTAGTVMSPAFTNHTANKTTGTSTDTLYAPGLLACDLTWFTVGNSTDSGYLSGTNIYQDYGKLMHYSLPNYGLSMPATVNATYAWFAVKSVKNNGSVTAKVYADNGSGAPGALLGTSVAQSVSALDTLSQGPTLFTFTTPVTITTNDIYVGIDFSALYTSHDTLALLETDDCSSADTLDAWEQWNDGTFHYFYYEYGFTPDLAIYPVISGKGLAVNNIAMQSFKAVCYPSPASGTAHISFTSPVSGIVSIGLKDMTGKLVSQRNVSASNGSTYNESIDVSNLSAGMYFCELNAGSNRQVLKVSVR